MDAHKKEAITQKYSGALMSNHKWRKLYLTMAEFGSDLCGIEYRFTDTDRVSTGTAPNPGWVLETGIDIYPTPGWVEFKHIESISIPLVFRFRAFENAPITDWIQDIEPFLTALERVGQFPVFREEH